MVVSATLYVEAPLHHRFPRRALLVAALLVLPGLYCKPERSPLAPSNAPSNAPSKSRPVCPAGVLIDVIPPLEQVGEPATWLRVTYLRTEDTTPPEWVLHDGPVETSREIRPWRPDMMVGYLIGAPGTVTVQAIGPCGIVGGLRVVHR